MDVFLGVRTISSDDHIRTDAGIEASPLSKSLSVLEFGLLLLTIGVFACVTLIWTGGLGDYALYLVQWHAQEATGEPWPVEFNGEEVAPNAYGPIHAILGLLFQVNWLLPKLIIAGSIVGLFAWACLAALREGRLTRRKALLSLAIFPLCPLVIFNVYMQGTNDAIPALALGLACFCRSKRMFAAAGLLIGLGALIKFYPLLFAPFLALDRERTVRLSVMLVAAGVFFVGMAFAYGVWGESVLSPFLFGAERGAKGLSLARVFELGLCPQSATALCSFFIDKNMYIVLAVATGFAIYSGLRDVDWEIALALAIPLIFFIYKVGHNQFLVSWLAVLLFVLMQVASEHRSRLLRASVPLIVFLCVLKGSYMVFVEALDSKESAFFVHVGTWTPWLWMGLLIWLFWAVRSQLRGRQWRFPRIAF